MLHTSGLAPKNKVLAVLASKRNAKLSSVLCAGDVVLTEFVEVETGKNNERPRLAAAMAACRKHRAKLLIAKLDRLSRKVSFIAPLMESNVKFVACDMPDADPFRLHIYGSGGCRAGRTNAKRIDVQRRCSRSSGT